MDLCIAAFTVMILAIIMYAYYIVKLMWRLEADHPAELEELNLPKKISRFCYQGTPRTAVNLIKFVYSNNNLNDTEIEYLKPRIKIAISLFLIGLVSGTYLSFQQGTHFPK